MGPQGPLGCASGIRRTVPAVQLPSACLRGSSSLRPGCFRRRLVCPAAAIGLSEVLWSDADAALGPLPVALPREADLPAPARGSPTLPPPAATSTVADRQVLSSHSQPSQQQQQREQEQLRMRQQHQQQHHQHVHQQQQRQEAAQQLVQRLVPTTPPMGAAARLPARAGVSAGGVALGVLLTVALQLVVRWLQRQRWAQQLAELLDLRRSSGSAASTSGKYDSGDATGGGSRSVSSRRAFDNGGDDGDGDGGGDAAAAAGRSAFLGGSTAGSLPGSPLGTVDGGGSAAAVAAGAGAVAGGARSSSGSSSSSSASSAPPGVAAGLVAGADPGESVEWVNMCWRKVWRVYQRGLERWIIDLLQPVFDGLVKDGSVPRWLCRLRVVELTLDHEAPYFSNMRRRNSRKDSDLNGVVDLRYTGGARMLLMLELGEGRWRFKVPVLVSDLDLECRLWLKLRLAPMCPWIGTISLAFVGPPNVKVQLSPYNRVRLMRVPVVQNYLRKLLTVELPALMVLPQRLEINIPPSVTTIAEAAVGRDTIMRAVASAVLQADAVEAALLSALPLGPQTPAGGVSLPEAFKGELSVALREARDLPVWGFAGQSNPYCRLVLGEQAVQSRRECDTSHPGRHRAPVWNQEFQFLVEDPNTQILEMLVKDSHLTGRTEVGRASIKLADVLRAQHAAEGGKVSMWVPLQPATGSYGITGGEAVPTGDVLVELSYKAFDDDEHDSGYREAENFSKQLLAAAQAPITDIRSAAAASSRAAVAASAAVSAIAMTRAAAARAAARAARAAQEAAAAAAGAAKGAVDQGASMIAPREQPPPPPQQQPVLLPPPAASKQLPAKAGADVDAVAEELSSAGDGADGGGSGGAVEAQQHDLAASSTAAAVVPGQRLRLPEAAADVITASDGARLLSEEAAVKAMAAPSTTAAASAAQTPAAARTAMAVLERPPAISEAHALVTDGDGGDDVNGHCRSHDAGSGYGSAWRQRHSDGGASPSNVGPDGHGMDGINGSGGGGVAAGLEAAAVAVQVLEPSPHAAADGARSRGPPRRSAGQQPEDEPPVIEVAAAVVMATLEDGSGRSGGGGAKAPLPGAGGPVLSALAHLTASAHSLTVTAIDKARESLSPQRQPRPEEPAAPAEKGAAEGGGGSGTNWLVAIVSRLPKYGGGNSGSPHHHAISGGEDEDEAASIGASRTTDAADEHPWWQCWVPKGGAAKLHDAAGADGGDGTAAAAVTAAASSSKSSGTATSGASDGAARGKPWWQFWSDGDREPEGAADGRRRRRDGGREDGDDGGDGDGSGAASKPVEAIYIPPDLPLEEIAAEVQRLKEDSWRERSDHVSGLWMKAVERNDRKWLMLAAFLLSVAVGLLTVVAWRLEQLEHLQAAAPQVAPAHHAGGPAGAGAAGLNPTTLAIETSGPVVI